MNGRLLMVGAGMAAAYLLQELAKRRHGLRITVVGEEAEACYNRVLLSNVLSGENSESDLDMLAATTDAAAAENRLQPRLVTGARIVHIDSAVRVATADTGERFPYDALVFATGAGVARPPMDCDGIAGVREFRTVADTRDLRAMDASGKRAVVVGGGLLGLEAAHGLNALGFDTSVVHRNPVLMNRQLDAAGGRQLQHDLEAGGLQFHLGAQVAGLETGTDSEIRGVRLDDGATLPCDLLLFATGIVPNIALAQATGLDTGRGIQVDERLGTSDPAIHALGECSQFGDTCFGLVAPIREQAAVLAAQLLDEPRPPFRLQDYPTQLKISGVDIYRAGELDGDAEQILVHGAGVYRRLVVRDNRLVGAVLVGDKRGGTWYSELIGSGRDISAFRSTLAFGLEPGENPSAAVAA